jgi:integrase/recombinase XerD
MNTLRQAAQEYLNLRRSLGYKLSWAGKVLPAFVTFMEKHHASYITTRLALAWAQQPSTVQPRMRAQRLSVVRLFARHRSATDPRTQIPPEGLLHYHLRRAQPYLYSTEEIRALLHAALSLPARRSLRPWTYHCLFGLLAVTGILYLHSFSSFAHRRRFRCASSSLMISSVCFLNFWRLSRLKFALTSYRADLDLVGSFVN